MKESLFQYIDSQKDTICQMADFIFDHPEYDGKEYQAAGLLSDYLRDSGFQIESPELMSEVRAEFAENQKKNL